MRYAALFLAGAFLCNCIPHLSAGLRGGWFPTPFSRPRGVANSSPMVNFLWGFFNVCVGIVILSHRQIVIGLNFDCVAIAAGALLLGTYLSHHFGKVRRERAGST
jgi:hypothetical protein